MAEVVRIRRDDGAYFLGWKGSGPVFAKCEKGAARVCHSRASAEALCSDPRLIRCEVVVELEGESTP